MRQINCKIIKKYFYIYIINLNDHEIATPTCIIPAEIKVNFANQRHAKCYMTRNLAAIPLKITAPID